MMKIVHCKREPFTHYIGRPGPLGNPFTVDKWGRLPCIDMFEEHARQSGPILDAIMALPADAVLGCWCHKIPWHGEAIIRIWNELHS